VTCFVLKKKNKEIEHDEAKRGVRGRERGGKKGGKGIQGPEKKNRKKRGTNLGCDPVVKQHKGGGGGEERSTGTTHPGVFGG